MMLARNKTTCNAKTLTLTGALVLILISINASAQWTGLRVNGEQIEDVNGKNVVLKGFGTGEIYNTEAYMLEWQANVTLRFLRRLHVRFCNNRRRQCPLSGFVWDEHAGF
jgi:hypothetical protein